MRVSWLSPESVAAPLSSKALLVAVLNAPSYGAGLRFAPEAKINDGLLDLVLVEDMKVLELLRALPLLILRGEVCSPRVKRFSIRHVLIETDSPCRFHGDGESLGYTPVEIEVLPQAVRVLCPPGSTLLA